MVIAALLHDAIEDQGITREQIVHRFGEDVADLVAEVSDDKSLPKAERKARQVKTASGKSPRAKVLKLADKTTNLRAIATSPPVHWDPARKSSTSLGPGPSPEVFETLRVGHATS